MTFVCISTKSRLDLEYCCSVSYVCRSMYACTGYLLFCCKFNQKLTYAQHVVRKNLVHIEFFFTEAKVLSLVLINRVFIYGEDFLYILLFGE